MLSMSANMELQQLPVYFGNEVFHPPRCLIVVRREPPSSRLPVDTSPVSYRFTIIEVNNLKAVATCRVILDILGDVIIINPSDLNQPVKVQWSCNSTLAIAK